MASVFRIRRRAANGVAGAPAALKSAELAYNMADGLFYAGYGDDGAGNATSVKAFAQDGYVPGMRVPAGGGAGQILTKSGAGDYATAWQDPVSPLTAGTDITIVGGAVNVGAGVARLASPTFTGAPLAPTAGVGTNNTQIATTGFVKAAIDALLNGAGAAYDTLKELQDLIVTDVTNIAALVVTVSGKLQKDQNLSDLANAATARGNLGLGSMAVQAANAVAITGGTIDGITFDGGTF